MNTVQALFFGGPHSINIFVLQSFFNSVQTLHRHSWRPVLSLQSSSLWFGVSITSTLINLTKENTRYRMQSTNLYVSLDCTAAKWWMLNTETEFESHKLSLYRKTIIIQNEANFFLHFYYFDLFITEPL
jgi:hypothetical protein